MAILRRLALLAGVLGCLWMYFDSPPALFRVRIRQTQVNTSGKRIDVAGEAWDRFFRRVADATAAEGTGNLTPNEPVSGGFLYVGTGDAPLNSVLPGIQRIYESSSSLVTYLVAESQQPRLLEVWYETKPRETRCPPSILYPRRAQSWLWLAGGLLLYLLIPRPKAGENIVGYDRTGAVLGLDALGTLITALFFGVSLYSADASAALLGERAAGTVFLWCLALPGVALVAWAAWNESFRLELVPGAIRVSRLHGTTEFSLTDCTRLAGMTRGGTQEGLILERRGGSPLHLRWDNLLHFERVMDHLRAHGLTVGSQGPAQVIRVGDSQ